MHCNFLNSVTYGNRLNYATLFSLKYSLLLVWVGLAVVWGGNKQGWACSGRKLYLCLIFLGIYFVLQPFSQPDILTSHWNLFKRPGKLGVKNCPQRYYSSPSPDVPHTSKGLGAQCLSSTVHCKGQPCPPIGTTYLVSYGTGNP